MSNKIIGHTQNTYEKIKSKFICYLVPYKDFYSKMEELKAEHPKARHFVYAYRFINEFEQIVENQSDDGEPKGSSGPPSLAVLRGNKLVDTGAIIVRYFGGTKLGVGGLIRAYGKSINLAIEVAEKENSIKKYVKLIKKTYQIEIQNTAVFDHFIKDIQDIILERDFIGLSCTYKIRTTHEHHKKIKSYLSKNNI